MSFTTVSATCVMVFLFMPVRRLLILEAVYVVLLSLFLFNMINMVKKQEGDKTPG